MENVQIVKIKKLGLELSDSAEVKGEKAGTTKITVKTDDGGYYFQMQLCVKVETSAREIKHTRVVNVS